MKDTFKYWKQENTIKYDTEDLMRKNVRGRSLKILSELGIPKIDNEYYAFHPPIKLEFINIFNKEFIVLGKRNGQENIVDNLIILDNKDYSIHFYSKSLRAVGMTEQAISKINTNMDSFLVSVKEIIELSKLIDTQAPFEKIESEIIKAISVIKHEDSSVFKEKGFMFWKELLQSFVVDVNEIYKEFINLPSLIKQNPAVPRIPTKE